MTTERQRKANQKNGKASTGPKSPEGLERSSLNSLSHGVYATTPDAIPNGRFAEDPAVVRDFTARILGLLVPENVLEEEHAMHIAVLYLRMRRLSRLEVAGLCEANLDDALRFEEMVSRIGGSTARQLEDALVAYRENRERRHNDPGYRSMRKLADLIREGIAHDTPGLEEEKEMGSLGSEPTDRDETSVVTPLEQREQLGD